MKESSLQRKIRRALESAYPTSYWWKTHGGPFTPAGIPDLVGCVHGHLCALEVKRPGENASRVQEVVMSRLRRAGAIVGVVRSIDDALLLVHVGVTA